MAKTVSLSVYVASLVLVTLAAAAMTIATLVATSKRRRSVVLRKPLSSKIIPIQTQDTTVWLELLSESPRVMMYHNLLSLPECQHLIELAEPRMARSTVQGKVLEKSNERTSFTTNLLKGETKTVDKIEQRLVTLSAQPRTNMEPLQVVRYHPGQFYRPHYDYFPTGKVGTAEALKRGGQRTVTFFIYLNDLPASERGGGTRFPKLNLTVRPRAGTALFFCNLRPDGSEDDLTFHGGDPPERSVKYGLNAWFRQQEFR